MDDFIYIDTHSALVDFCERIKGSPWLAVDTEFEREKTYYPELCLLQVGNKEVAAAIDPIVLDDLSPILALFYDPSIIKVFHSGRQDLEIFFHLKGAVPAPIFDTQLAAPLLGYQEQVGYANLVKAMVNVELSKSHTRTDWKRRPLNDGQLRYAVDDVIYLGQIYEIMSDKLAEMDRVDWLEKECKTLADPKLYEPDTDKVWKRIRSANRLKGKKLAVLQALAKWREETARTDNKPRNWIMRDDAMIDIAHQLPENNADLIAIKGLQDHMAKRYGASLLAIIKTAQTKSPDKRPDYKKREVLNANQEAVVEAMMAIVRIRAAENNLNHTVLAPRKEIEHLLNHHDSIIDTGWRAEMIGQELQSFLEGKVHLKVQGKTLVIEHDF